MSLSGKRAPDATDDDAHQSSGGGGTAVLRRLSGGRPTSAKGSSPVLHINCWSRLDWRVQRYVCYTQAEGCSAH